jgi:hypothetical protein
VEPLIHDACGRPLTGLPPLSCPKQQEHKVHMGWYKDPAQSGLMRWWGGRQWSETFAKPEE